MPEGEDKIIHFDFRRKTAEQESPDPTKEVTGEVLGSESVDAKPETEKLDSFTAGVKKYLEMGDFLRMLGHVPNSATRATHQQSIKRMTTQEMCDAVASSNEMMWRMNPTYYMVLFQNLTAAKLFDGFDPKS